MRNNMKRSVMLADYLPAVAFLLIAAGWLSMILLRYNPTSMLAWVLTLWMNDLLREVFYFLANLADIPVVGHLLIAVSIAALGIAAARCDWRGCRFVISHAALILMVMPLIGQSRSLSGPPGDLDFRLIYRVTDSLSPISLIFALGLLAACLVCHYHALKSIERERALRRRLWTIEISW